MIYKFFRPLLKSNSIALTILILAPASMVLESNIIPYGLKRLIDLISFSREKKEILSELMVPVTIILFAWITKNLITRSCYYLESKIIPNLQRELRTYSLKIVLEHSYSFFLNNLSGDIANRINSLPDSFENIRQLICWNVISAVIIVSTSCFMLWQVSYQFSLILVIWTVLHVFIVFCFVRKIERASHNHSDAQSILNGYIIDLISNIMSFKSFENIKNLDHIKLQQDSEVIVHEKMMRKILLFQIISDIPICILISVTLYLLIQGWYYDKITAGDFVLVFNIVISVMYNIVGLGHVLTDIFREMGRVRQSLQMIMQNDLEQESPNLSNIHITEGKIKFLNISFGYSKNNLLFHNLNLNLSPGKKIGIVGVSGSGKSSLIKLLFRLYDPSSGDIEIDGQNIHEVSLSSLRSQITYMPQEVKLFHQSIKDNIKYGNQQTSDFDVIQSAKQAYCHEFIMQMPNGYETIVGEGGQKLSGGQKQRIILARALLKNTSIFVFDESTSSQDIETENLIYKSLSLFCKNKTIIFISHKLSTVSIMDEIIFLENGKVLAQGKHEELVLTNFRYRQFLKL